MEQQNLPMELPKAGAENAGTMHGERAATPKEWLSIAFNAALGSAFSVLVFLALYVAFKTWGWADFGKFLLVVALLTLLEMRIIEPLTQLLHNGDEATPPPHETRKVRVQRAIVIALVFTTLMEAFNLIIGGEAFKIMSEGKEINQIAGLQFAFVTFVMAFFAVGTITFGWAWGASMKRRLAGVIGLLIGLIVGVCLALLQQSAPEIMTALYKWFGLPAQDWSTMRVTPYEAFTQHLSIWATSGFIGGVIIDLRDSMRDVGLLSFAFFLACAVVVSFGVLWILIYPVHWLLFGSSLYPFLSPPAFGLSLATEVHTWAIIVRNIGWGIGIAACAHSGRLFIARKPA
jgi:hypothetical protein